MDTLHLKMDFPGHSAKAKSNAPGRKHSDRSATKGFIFNEFFVIRVFLVVTGFSLLRSLILDCQFLGNWVFSSLISRPDDLSIIRHIGNSQSFCLTRQSPPLGY